jgi:hypothetical protein
MTGKEKEKKRKGKKKETISFSPGLRIFVGIRL